MIEDFQAQSHDMLEMVRAHAQHDPLRVDGHLTATWYHLQLLELAVLAGDALVLLANTIKPEDATRLTTLANLERRMNEVCTSMADAIVGEDVP